MKQDLSKTVQLSVLKLSKEQLDSELQKGMDDIATGNVLSANEVEKQLRRSQK